VRPERLFALRAHPFGVALRAINLAENGQVVELPCCLPGVRIYDVELREPMEGSRARNTWCARRDCSRRTPLGLRFASARRRCTAASNFACGEVVELPWAFGPGSSN